MRPIKAIITCCLLFLSSWGFSQTAEKTLVKAFNLQGNSEVVLDLPGNVDVQQWSNTIMRVQMDVSLENGTNSMLKSLITAGRFNLKSNTENDAFYVHSPAMQKKVTVSGTEIKEKINYTVFVPDYVLVRLHEPEATTKSESDSEENGSSM